MNYLFILIISLTIAFTGCKLRKDTHTTTRTDRQVEAHVAGTTSWVQHMGSDSTTRYWSFTSDSNFFFHPNLGLWSFSGQIAYAEQQAVKHQVIAVDHSYDSVRIENSKTASHTQVKIASSPIKGWLWLLVIIPVVAVFLWWRRKLLM